MNINVTMPAPVAEAIDEFLELATSPPLLGCKF